jgi:hypothetical protein
VLRVHQDDREFPLLLNARISARSRIEREYATLIVPVDPNPGAEFFLVVVGNAARGVVASGE